MAHLDSYVRASDISVCLWKLHVFRNPLPETFCLSLISDSECLCTPQQVDHKIVEMAGWSWTYPHKLGYDVAGVIQALGPNCMRLHVGDEVWGEAGAFGAFGAFNIKADPFPRLPCQRPPL